MESIRLARQGADGAEIDDISRHFCVHDFLDVCADLHVVATSSRAELINASDFIGKSDTPRAVNAACHDGLHEWSQVFVFDCSLAGNLMEARSVASVSHALVLQIALSCGRTISGTPLMGITRSHLLGRRSGSRGYADTLVKMWNGQHRELFDHSRVVLGSGKKISIAFIGEREDAQLAEIP